MPDITMCSNYNCEKRSTCYRYTAMPAIYQSYSLFDDLNCDFYWKAKIEDVEAIDNTLKSAKYCD